MKRLVALFDSRLGRIARYVVSVGLIGWFALHIDWHALRATRTDVAWKPLLAATGLSALLFPLLAVRWWLLLRVQGIAVSFRWTHAVTWIGQFYNSFLLGGLGGDVARAYYVVRAAPDKKVAGLAAIFLDRVSGLVVLAGIALIALLTKFSIIVQQPGLRKLGVGAAGLLLVTAAAVFLLRMSIARLPAQFGRWLGPVNATALSAALNRTAGARREYLLAIAISATVWCADFIAVWLLTRAAGLPLPFLETCLAMSVAHAATVLPVSVGGHGVREGTLLGVFALLGLLPDEESRQRALLLALLVWAVTVFYSLIGGVVLLVARTQRTASST